MPTPDSSNAPIMMPTAAVMEATVIQRRTPSSKARTRALGVSQFSRLGDMKLTTTTTPQV